MALWCDAANKLEAGHRRILMSTKRILYISQEITPYVDETEISKVSRYLPEFIQQHKNEVRLFMPKYGIINERRNQLHEVIRLSGANICIDNRDHPLFIKVASIQTARMQVYFINNDDFFKRKTDYAVPAKGANDNDERAIFFVRGSLETVKKLRWVPDVIHCHGAFSALAALYLRKVYQDEPVFEKAKIVVSLYNEEQPVVIPDTLFKRLDFDNISEADYAVMEGKTDLNALLRLAIAHADAVVEGSQDLPAELKDYVASTGKPCLAYPGEEHPAEVYNDFYATL